MQRLIMISSFLFLPLLFSCQSNNGYSNKSEILASSLYLETHFIKPVSFAVESEQDIFMLDDEMRSMVENELNNAHNAKEKAAKLLKHLFSKEKISISYSNTANLTARDTYHSHLANCISLTIMAYALAEEANLNINFQQVKVPEYWIRNGQYNFLTGHVNLIITPENQLSKYVVYGNNNIQIDFDPYTVKQNFPKKIIQKNTVLAMFYNNKGGQALVDKEYDVAYQYFKAATFSDKYFSPAWGNLAVLYRLTNHLKMAEKTYRYAIQINPNNLTALTNLAILLRKQQHNIEADIIEKRLLAKRNKNPYYHALLADEAYFNYDYQQALKHYQEAIKLNHNIHEIYFGMAKVYYQMNKLTNAKKAMQRALKLNKEKSTGYQYLAKLNFLKAELTH